MSAERRADLAYFVALAFGVLFIVLGGPLARRLEMVRLNDFSYIWAGGRAIVLGVSPWDPARYYQMVTALDTQTPDALVYAFMPWVGFLVAPLGLLPLETAAWVWMIGGMACMAIAVRALLRAFVPGRAFIHGAFGAALFVGQPSFHAIVLGQWSPLLMSGVAATVLALRASRPLVAALVSPLFFVKPQVLVLGALGFAYGALRESVFRRYLLFAAIVTGGLIVVTWLAVPDWFPAWMAEIFPRRTVRSAVLPSAFNQLLGPEGRLLAYALIAAGAVLASRFRPGSDASLAVWLSLSGAGAIYSWSADHVLLFVPAVMTTGLLLRRSERAARRFALSAAGVLLFVSPVLYGIAVLRHDETFSVVVPLALFVATVVLLWPERGAAPARSVEVAAAS